MQKVNTKRMAQIALLMALVVVLQLLGGMLPTVSGFALSFVLIPIVVGAAAFGPVAGAILGGTFGVIAVIGCVSGTDMGGAMVFQANPVLCVLVVMAKGILAGAASGAVYRLLSGKNGYIAMLCAAAVCPIVNTGVFLICMALFFKDVLAAWAGGGDVLAYVLSGLVLCSFVPELLINLVFSPAGQRIVQFVKKH